MQNMTEPEARRAAAEILLDEANELQLVCNEQSRKGEQKDGTAIPHRAICAIQREVRRFKEIASVLKGEGQE